MTKRKKLTKKQMFVIKKLFDENILDLSFLAEEKISRETYLSWWLTDENWQEEFQIRLLAARKFWEVTLVKFCTVAVTTLVGLLNTEKPDVTRRVCIDILNYAAEHTPNALEHAEEEQKEQKMRPETAGKILDVLAKDCKVRGLGG